MSIFKDPKIDNQAIHNASMRSQESLATLYKVQVKKNLRNKRLTIDGQGRQNKEKFESMMKRILDRAVNM